MKKTDVVKSNFERAITLNDKNITSTSNLSQDVEGSVGSILFKPFYFV